MPNTLAHFAVNAAASRPLGGMSDVKWVLLGAVIPDIPFIIKRGLVYLFPAIDVLDLRLIAIVQASLLFSLLLAVGCSLLSKDHWRVLGVLSLGVVVHLLLDAAQTKWGNGPAFFAPFDWTHTNFQLFWPEAPFTYLLTLLGVLYVSFVFPRSLSNAANDLVLFSYKRIAGIAVVCLIYLFAPLLFMDDVEASGAGRVKQIRAENRAGSSIEIDRARYRNDAEGTLIELYSGHFIPLEIEGADLEARGKISIRGVFVKHDVLQAQEYHVNHGRFRELASILGLAAALGYWVCVFFAYARQDSHRRRPHS